MAVKWRLWAWRFNFSCLGGGDDIVENKIVMLIGFGRIGVFKNLVWMLERLMRRKENAENRLNKDLIFELSAFSFRFSFSESKLNLSLAVEKLLE